jgi:hypothetical protein
MIHLYIGTVLKYESSINFFAMSLKIPDFLQARLYDIITSSKVANCNEPVEFPWMVDGAGVPKNAAQLLTSLV